MDTTPIPEASKPAGAPGPSPEEIFSHLAQVVQSPAFHGAGRAQTLLRHLAQKTLSGAAGELKEYTLGVEVFDRGTDFDPRLDPIVRVEVSRLRGRLQKFYETDGANAKVRISLPRGTYVPTFSFPPIVPPPAAEAPTPAPPLAEQPTGAPTLPLRKVLLGAGALLLLAAAIGTGIRALRPGPAVAQTFTNFRRITSAGHCTTPVFSPDEENLAYSCLAGDNWDLFIRNLQTNTVKNLTKGPAANNRQPAWSPDGETLAFRSSRAEGGIFLLNRKTQAVRQLTKGGYHPAWSPDGRHIAFSTGTFLDATETPAGGRSELRLVDVATGKIEALTKKNTVFDALQPAWSHDGRRIAFWGQDADGNRDVWTIPVDPAHASQLQPVPVTQDGWTDWNPQWSPDGQFLYFISDRGGAMNLWRSRIGSRSGHVEGQPEAVTTPSSYTGWFSLAPSGKKFVYVNRLMMGELFEAPFDPKKGVLLEQRKPLTAGEQNLREPTMSPLNDWIAVRIQDPQEDLAVIRPDGRGLRRLTNDVFADRNPRWSPDGERISFSSNRSGRFELWTIHKDGHGLKQLTHGGLVAYCWAPDGTIWGYPAGKPPINLETGQATQGTEQAAEDNSETPALFVPMSWAPNGSAAMGRMRAPGLSSAALFIYSPKAHDYWQIAPTAYFPSAAWLSDNQQLLFSSNEGIFLADTKTHTVRPATDIQLEMNSRVTLSKDNDTLYFVYSEDFRDIWLAAP